MDMNRSGVLGTYFIYFCFIDYTKAFDCVDHNKLWKILKEMEIPDHLTCLLRNLYAGQKSVSVKMNSIVLNDMKINHISKEALKSN